MNIKVWKWLVKNGRSSLLFIALLTVGSILLSMISLQFSMQSKTIIDIATGASDKNFISACVSIAIMLALMLVVQISVSFINVHASSRLEIALKNHIFGILLRKDYLAVSEYHSGELLNRINSDVSVIVSGIVAILPKAALFLTSVIGAFVLLWKIDNFLAIAILAIGPFVLIGARLYSRRYKALHKMAQAADGKTKSFMLEMLRNLLVVKSFSNEELMLAKSE